jgi:phage shock protein PspC (stress-responsive transcriptional regulator)
MNKIIDIHLGGITFRLDEPAYIALVAYLEALGKHLEQTESREEVLADIEARIAEIFHARLEGQRTVLGMADVTFAREALGQPEDFGEATQPPSPSRRRLFRDGEGQILSGVCSGLSHYFSVDVVWIRAAFLLTFLFSGMGLVLYFILWGITPRAESAADRLAMRGEPATFENIWRTVETEGRRNAGARERGSVERGPRRFLAGLIEVFVLVLRGIGVFFLLLMFLGLLVAGAVLVAVGDGGFWSLPSVQSLELFLPTGMGWMWVLVAGQMLVMGLLGLLVMGVARLLGKGKGLLFRRMVLPLLLLTGLGFATWVVIGVRMGLDHEEDAEVAHVVQLPAGRSDWVLGWGMSAMPGEAGSLSSMGSSDGSATLLESAWRWTEDSVYFDDIVWDIRSTQDSVARLEWSAFAQGGSHRAARARAEHVSYPVAVDSTGHIGLGDCLGFPKADRFRDQHVEVVLYLPIGHKIRLDPGAEAYWEPERGFDFPWDDGDGGGVWRMAEDGLQAAP